RGLALQRFVVYSTSLPGLGGMRPPHFFRAIHPAAVTAFSTASSNATLPTALQVAEEGLRLPPQVSRFVLSIGSTANQNGTALFEGVTVLFLAQFYGVDLTLGQQVLVVFICILGGVGTAGVPAGSIPVVAMILGMVGVPPDGIGIILRPGPLRRQPAPRRAERRPAERRTGSDRERIGREPDQHRPT